MVVGIAPWRPAAEDACPVEVFHVELGDPGTPVLVLIHGWPTSSIDWFDVAGQLSAGFRVCALDFPGYGFSARTARRGAGQSCAGWGASRAGGRWSTASVDCAHALEDTASRYDVVLVDTPPSLGILTLNALVAADLLLAPVQCEYLALEGVAQLMETIELVRATLNPRLELLGMLMTMFDPRTRLSPQVVEEVRRHFPDKTFETVIPRSVRLSEAPSYGKPVLEYEPSSRGASAYADLAQELIQRGLLRR